MVQIMNMAKDLSAPLNICTEVLISP